MLPLIGNLAYGLMLCAFVTRDLLSLRAVLIAGQSLAILYAWWNGVPIIAAWNVLFVGVNAWMAYQLVQDRLAVRVPEDVRPTYERHFAPLRGAAEALRSMPVSSEKAWTAAWADFDELFHRTIAEASGNRRLAADIGRYRLLHKGFNRLSTDPVSLQQAMKEHLGILEALESRDGRLARERMIAHIGAWQDFFRKKVFDPAAPAPGAREGA